MMKTGLNERQIEILKLIDQFRFLSMKCIQMYYGLSNMAVRLIGRRLKKIGLIKVERVFYKGDSFFILDKLGANIMGHNTTYALNYPTLIHDEYVNTLAIDNLKKGSTITFEHEFKKTECFGIVRPKKLIFPDLVVDDVAYEVELTAKHITRIRKKILKLDTVSEVKTVRWISNNKKILENVSKICSDKKHEFYFFKDDILNLQKFEKPTNKHAKFVI